MRSTSRVTSVPRLLSDRLATDPGSPLITFYDDATGERVELSTATLDNWVAKTANLLVDGLGLGPGDSASVRLPLHWQAAVAVLACASAGLEVVESSDDRPAVAFWAEGDGEPPDADDVLGLSLRPLAGPLTASYPGVTDYAREVAGYGDRFTPQQPTELTVGEPISDRVLVTDELPVQLLLAVIAGGGSLVVCRNPVDTALARRAATERITKVLRNGALVPPDDQA
jgi:uncharacterized protein (TIGR03089 family)